SRNSARDRLQPARGELAQPTAAGIIGRPALEVRPLEPVERNCRRGALAANALVRLVPRVLAGGRVTRALLDQARPYARAANRAARHHSHYDTISRTTLPSTSVSRKSRPLKRYVSRV